MSEHRKYGYCKASERWVPRDDMLGINVKLFDENNHEERVMIRLSPHEWDRLRGMLKSLEWDNRLKTEGELNESDARRRERPSQ